MHASLDLNGLNIQPWTSFYPTSYNADIEEALCGIEIGIQLTLRYALYTAIKTSSIFRDRVFVTMIYFLKCAALFPYDVPSTHMVEFVLLRLYRHWNIPGTLLWRHNGRDGVSSRLITQPFIQAQIKENTKAPRRWPLWGEFTGDLWIPRTKGQ